MKDTILIVDDNKDSLTVMEDVLHKGIPEVDIIKMQDPMKVMECLDNSQVSVIVLDVNMPGMTGIKLCNLIKSSDKSKHIPVLLITSHNTSSALKSQSLDVGADDFLTRPINNIELVARIKVALRIYRAESELRAISDEAKEEVLEGEEKFSAVVEQSLSAIEIYELDGRLSIVNDAWSKFWQLKKEDISDFNILKDPECERTGLTAAYKKAKKGKAQILPELCYDPEGSGLTGGRKRWISARMYPMKSSKGSVQNVVLTYDDITERKQAAEELHESEEKFRAIFENAPVLIDAFDENGKCILWNKHCEEVFGWTIDELNESGDPLSLFYPDSEIYNEVIKSIISAPDRKFGEWKPYTKSGKQLVTRWANFQLSDGFRFSLGYDITERKQAEEELKTREETLNEAQKIAKIGSWEMDVITKEIMWSEQMYSILELSPDQEPTYELYYSCVHPDDLEYVKSSAAKVYEKNELPASEYRLLTSSGAIKYVLTERSQFFDKKGNIIKLTGIVQDITERKKAEEKLILQSNVLDQINDTVTITNLDGEIIFINQAQEKNMGFNPGDAIGRTTEVYGEDHERGATQKEILEYTLKDGSWRGLVVNQIKDGSEIIVDLRTQIIRDEGGKPIFLAGIGTNITEQVQAKEALKESEKQLRNIFKNSTNMYYSHNPEHIITYLSPQVEEMLGFAQKEAMIKWMELASDNPINETGFKNTVRAIETGKRQPPYELELVRKDGRKITVEVNEQPLCEDGKTISIVGSLTDITKRKQIDKALKESEETHRTLLDNLASGIVVHAADSSIVYANPGACKLLGLSEDQLMGKKAIDPQWKFLNDDNSNMILEDYPVNRIISTDKPLRNFVVGVVRPHIGDIAWLLTNGYSVNDDSGENKEIIINFTDITEHKLAEEAMQLLVENTMVVTGQEFFDRIVKGVCKWLGVECAIIGKIAEGDTVNALAMQLDGKLIHDYSYGLDGTPCRNTVESGFCFYPDNICNMFPKDKDLVDMKAEGYVGVPLRKQDGGVLGVLCVISHKKLNLPPRAEEVIRIIAARASSEIERDQLEERLRQMDKMEAVGHLAGGIAHDFNNILTGIFGNLLLAKNKLSEDHPIFRSLEESSKAMDRATALTSQLLTFSKGGNPIKEDVSIEKLVRETVKFDLSGSNVKPIFKIEKDLRVAKVDKGQMQQVFSNFTINAAQAMPNGGKLYITLENADVTKEMFPGLDPGKYIKCIIRDEGTGISQKQLGQIFDPYFTTKQKGSGLGLATVYSIINKHGGYISVDSELEIGTTFTFYLPASESVNVPEPKQVKIEKKGENTLKSARILVMDDDLMICELVSEILEVSGFTVETAFDGKQAIQMYKKSLKEENPFDIVIMDLTIPGGVGGKEAIKDLLKINPDVKCIVSSGYANDATMSNYADYGFKSIVTKPYTPTILLEEINRLLND